MSSPALQGQLLFRTLGYPEMHNFSPLPHSVEQRKTLECASGVSGGGVVECLHGNPKLL